VNTFVDVSLGRASTRTLGIAPERLLVVANAVSLSRGVLAAALVGCYLLGTPPAVLAAVVIVLWLTDAADGRIARLGHRRTAARLDGQALDPLMDDLGFVAGFLVLLDAGLVPVWFVVALLASRTVFSLIRMIGLARMAQNAPGMSFARPQRLTKLNGASLSVGQIVLFLALAGVDGGLAVGTITAGVVAVMSTTSVVSIYQFVVRTHWRTLAGLLAP
jgi:phosphatidylglycerophosphate synthase